MAGPKRIPFKNLRAMQHEYHLAFAQWFAAGALLSWPIACAIGYRMQSYQGGVGVVPYQRICEEYPVVRPNHAARKWFRRYAFGLTLVGAYCFANYMTDDNKMHNEWYSRPDFKPKAAMVSDSSAMYDDQVYKQMQGEFHNTASRDESKKSSVYRFFRPLNADYDTVNNPYAGRTTANFNPEGGKFPTLTNDYADHEA